MLGACRVRSFLLPPWRGLSHMSRNRDCRSACPAVCSTNPALILRSSGLTRGPIVQPMPPLKDALTISLFCFSDRARKQLASLIEKWVLGSSPRKARRGSRSPTIEALWGQRCWLPISRNRVQGATGKGPCACPASPARRSSAAIRCSLPSSRIWAISRPGEFW